MSAFLPTTSGELSAYVQEEERQRGAMNASEEEEPEWEHKRENWERIAISTGARLEWSLKHH
ncbi:Hypothetical predicted protein [Podarcis lilfordi]|uniref:Uncharacterized protein n=1 Tax=Podarcis lilfordi TaxID=74358 RepID=A0AA35K8I1_9SAUR|nr:Hypothetical predicted protein [Podarcis lilfordi]